MACYWPPAVSHKLMACRRSCPPRWVATLSRFFFFSLLCPCPSSLLVLVLVLLRYSLLVLPQSESALFFVAPDGLRPLEITVRRIHRVDIIAIWGNDIVGGDNNALRCTVYQSVIPPYPCSVDGHSGSVALL